MGAMSAGLDQGMWLEERLGNDSDVLDLIGPNPPRTLALLAVAATLAA
jgi:hypothetical protein